MPIVDDGVPVRLEPEETPDIQRQSRNRERATIISITFGIAAYIAVYLIGAVLVAALLGSPVLLTFVALIGGGGLLLQIPAIIIGVVTGRWLYLYLGRPPVKAA